MLCLACFPQRAGLAYAGLHMLVCMYDLGVNANKAATVQARLRSCVRRHELCAQCKMYAFLLRTRVACIDLQAVCGPQCQAGVPQVAYPLKTSTSISCMEASAHSTRCITRSLSEPRLHLHHSSRSRCSSCSTCSSSSRSRCRCSRCSSSRRSMVWHPVHRN